MDSHSQPPSCCDDQDKSKYRPWYRSGLLWAALLTGTLLISSYFQSALIPFRETFIEMWGVIWWAIALGFFLGGLVDYYVPPAYISKFLARKGRGVIFSSVGLGLLASACSHGVLALAIELHKKGASGPAVVSFLLASPWANLPVTVLLVGFFGLKGLFIIAAALVVALTTGIIFQFLDARKLIEHNRHSVQVDLNFSVWGDVKKRFRAYRPTPKRLSEDAKGVLVGAWGLARMIFFWLLLGMLLASLAAAFVPESIFQSYLGPSLMGLLFTMLIATVLEVCSEGTAPLAFELYSRTGAFGNTFAFLMGGVVTDVTEIGLLWTRLGKKTAIWMIAVTIPQVLLIGWFYNVFF